MSVDLYKAKSISLMVNGEEHKCNILKYGDRVIWSKYRFDSYIKDGLVFQLDCTKECTPDKWTDLIGGINFVSNGNVRMDSHNVPYFDGNSLYRCETDLSYTASLSTVEAYVNYEGDYGGAVVQILSNIKPNTVAVSYSCGYKVIQYGTNGTHLSQAANFIAEYLPQAITMTEDTAILDSVVKTVVSVAGSGFDNTCCIGGRSNLTSSNWFIGKIYAIRIYDRLLSSEEMKANQHIDIKRFSYF